jgi:hypothetical protein
MATKSKFCNRCGRPLETQAERTEHRCGSCKGKKQVAKVETPELDKLITLKDEWHTEKIGEFIDWLSEQGIVLAKRHEHADDCYEEGFRTPQCGYRNDSLAPHDEVLEKLLARYVGVDLDKVEKERQRLLQAIRAAQ